MNLFLILASAGAAALHLRSGNPAHRTLARQLHLAAFASLSASLMVLLYLFLADKFAYDYVYRHSASTSPPLYKLAGVWAGRHGTLLVWIWAAVGALGLEDLRQRSKQRLRQPQKPAALASRDRRQRRRQKGRKPGPSGQARSKRASDSPGPSLLAGGFYAYVRTIGLLFAGGLALIQLSLDPFMLYEGTLQFPGGVPPEGIELNPLLQTRWMIIHPPVVFTSYGIMTPVLAAGLAFLLTRSRDWVQVATRWARWSWVGMGVGLLLGGAWAYVTLGWGGYWAWDPVETSSLLPWLGLTAFLHAAYMFRKRRSYSVLGPMLAALVVALVLFESFVTRGGVWLSVHSFLPGQTAGAGERFTSILRADSSVLGLFILLVGTVAITAALTLRALNRWPEPEPPQREKLEDYLDEETTLYGAIFTLLLILAVSLALLFMGVNGSIDAAVFDSRLTLFGVMLTAVFLLGTLYPWLAPKTLIALTGAALGLMALGGLVGLWVGGRRYMVGVALPAFAFAVGAIGYHLHRLRPRSPLARLKRASPWLVHLGVALLLLGYAANTSLAHDDRGWVKEGQSAQVAGYTLTLEELALPENFIRGDLATTTYRSSLTISDGGEPIATGEPAFQVHLDRNSQRTYDIFILNRPHEDVYVTLNSYNLQNGSAEYSVQVIPYINLVWLGAGLILIAQLLNMGLEWPPLRRGLKGLLTPRHEKEPSLTVSGGGSPERE